MRLTKHVYVHHLNPITWSAMLEAERVIKSFDCIMVVTSIVDGRHSPRSNHPLGLAFDVRTRTLRRKLKAHQFGVLTKALRETFADWHGGIVEMIDKSGDTRQPHWHFEVDASAGRVS